MYNQKTHEFLPIFNHDSKILILGSMPSVKSSALGFYYMHPSNRFWKVLSAVFHLDFVGTSVEEKTKMLLERKVALFDIVKACEIINSADSKIRNVVVQDLEDIINNTNIKKIYLNGNMAYKIFCRSNKKYVYMATLLPSTSAANANYNLDRLIAEWKVIIENN